MKRTALLLICLLSSIALFSQVSTTISGKILNHFDSQIGLKLLAYDTTNMREPDDYRYSQQAGIKGVIQTDSTYSIETKEINSLFTTCVLVFGSRMIQLVLSPGDSLHLDLDYWSFESTTNFKGHGAIRNQYYRQQDLYFVKSERYKTLYYFQGRSRIDHLKDYYHDQLDYLNEYPHIRVQDSAFFIWEQNRIKYSYYNDLIAGSFDRKSTDSLLITEVREVIKGLDLNDQNALLTHGSYRRLIGAYPSFMNKSYGDTPWISFGQEIALGQKYYSGIIRSYFLWNLIESSLLGTTDRLEKQLLVEFANDHIKDKKVKELLVAYKTANKNSSNTMRDIYWGVVEVLFVLLGVAFLIFVITWFSRRTKSKNSRVGLTWIKYGILITLVFIVLLFLFKLEATNIALWFWILSMVTFLGIHAFWLIPKFAVNKRYVSYAVLAIITVGLYGILLFLIIKTGYNWEAIPRWIVLKFVLLSLIPLLLGSFFVYYIVLLIKKNQSLSYLFEAKLLNIEVLVHAILIFIILLPVVVNIESQLGIYNLLLVVIILAYFYWLAFGFIPSILVRNKPAQAIIFILGLVLLTAVILTGIDVLKTYINLQKRGMELPWTRLLRFSDNLYILLFIFPALLYAFLRKKIIERNKQGFHLFRQKEAELNQLRSQVNPHFLFNSLNTVYAFALKENNPKTAEYLAKLSNLMRYLIEDMEKEKIPVEKEIEYIQDYINLQKVRSSVEHQIELKTDIQYADFQIAPMLMIPFVENAFKHGMNPNKASQLKIFIQVIDKHFLFEIENSVDKSFEAFYKEKGFGIGIENVRQRLDLIYPGQNSLTIQQNEELFSVCLTIQH